MHGRLRNYRQVSEEVDHHVREICGIALSKPPFAVRVQMVQALYLAGLCLEGNDEPQIIVSLLREIEVDLGWQAEYRVKDLKKEWGWGEDAGATAAS